MSFAVWEFKLKRNDVQDVEMPAGAKVLTLQVQRQSACIWALVNTEAPVELRTFRTFGTGHVAEGVSSGGYVGTWQQHDGALVWHVFDVTEGS